MHQRELLSPSQAARRAGVSSQAIKVWVDTGRVHGTRTALGRLIDRESLDRVIEERATRRAAGEATQ